MRTLHSSFSNIQKAGTLFFKDCIPSLMTPELEMIYSVDEFLPIEFDADTETWKEKHRLGV